MDEQAVRTIIRTKLQDGKLPHDSITWIRRRLSTGETCDACDTILAKDQWLVEATTLGTRHVQLHDGCLEVWLQEWRRLAFEEGAGSR